MKFEKRREAVANVALLPPTDLPVDYLRLVESTLTTALEKGLTALKKIHPIADFHANGAIYGDEILLTITLSHGPQVLAATTVFVSADFDPLATKPGIEAILSACLDAAGSIFDYYLDSSWPDRIEQIAHHSLSALDEAPFEWMISEPVAEATTIPVWVKMDKSNPQLEDITEQWLAKNDPDYQKKVEQKTSVVKNESEDFLNERLEAIKNAKSGSGNSGGPITH
jgi:hypothetical protein